MKNEELRIKNCYAVIAAAILHSSFIVLHLINSFLATLCDEHVDTKCSKRR